MRVRILFSFFVAAAAAIQAPAADCVPVRRALVVGINHYDPGSGRAPAIKVAQPLVMRLPVSGTSTRSIFSDLEGAVDDATDFAALLREFDFTEKNITLLTDEKATAQNILDSFQQNLIDASSCQGDVSVFYYSGHGSQIRNLAVPKDDQPDSYDQTLVPYDSADGVPDIRSKELVRLYVKAALKGIYLTVIADSCQSGGLTRGAASFARGKDLPADGRTVNDPGIKDPSGNPYQPTRRASGLPHPVLVLSAAYEKEEAREAGDHGVFTQVLLEKLKNHPQREAIGLLFGDVKAAVTTQFADQHPQIQGEGRLESDLFGEPADSTSGLIARLTVGSQGFKLDQGTAAGVYDGCELQGATPDIAGVRVRITQARLADSDIDIIDGGTEHLRPGSRFRLVKWVTPDLNSLRVFYDKSGPAADELISSGEAIAKLEAAGVKIISDPTVENPARQIWWLDGQWRLVLDDGMKTSALGKILDTEKIVKMVGAGKTLFVNFPLPAASAEKLDLGKGSHNDAVRVQTTPAGSDYFMVGRWSANGLEYAWIRPHALQEDQKAVNLPIRTDWVRASGDAPESDLRTKAIKLNRIKGWLTLELPGGSGGADHFPYHLALRKVKSSDFLQPDVSHTTQDEQYKVFLTATPEEISQASSNGNISQRWIYVLAIDRTGDIDVVIPAGEGNVGNYVPVEGTKPAEIQLTRQPWDFAIGPPFGLDTYILLVSDSEIDPRVLAATGVAIKSATRGATNPLDQLFGNIGLMRGTLKPVPTTWSIQRVTFQSVPK